MALDHVPTAAPVLFTCGYQGRDASALLAQVSDNGIRLLIDVRWRPLSRKPGFSKTKLHGRARELGLWYVHLPSLGIPSDQRQDPNDRARVLANYRHRIRHNPPLEVDRVAALARRCPVALLCYEADPGDCHRGVLARSIAERIGGTVVDL